MNSIDIPIGIVGRGRGSSIKTLVVEAEATREPIYLDPAATSYAALLPILGGTPITASLGGGRDLLLTEPTD